MNDWKQRALEATGALDPKGPQTQTGAILLAVLGLRPKRPPRFSGLATVSSDGFVFCDFETKTGSKYHGAFVCSVEDLRDNFRRLADHLKLSQADRDEMFSELLKWIAVDYRAIADAAKRMEGTKL